MKQTQLTLHEIGAVFAGSVSVAVLLLALGAVVFITYIMGR